jgi:hypothetical protein
MKNKDNNNISNEKINNNKTSNEQEEKENKEAFSELPYSDCLSDDKTSDDNTSDEKIENNKTSNENIQNNAAKSEDEQLDDVLAFEELPFLRSSSEEIRNTFTESSLNSSDENLNNNTSSDENINNNTSPDENLNNNTSPDENLNNNTSPELGSIGGENRWSETTVSSDTTASVWSLRWGPGNCRGGSSITTPTAPTSSGGAAPLLDIKKPLDTIIEPLGTTKDDEELYGGRKYEQHQDIYATFSKEELESINSKWKSGTLDKKDFYDIVDNKCQDIDSKTNLLNKEYSQDMVNKESSDVIASNINDFNKLSEHDKYKVRYLADEMFAKLEDNELNYREYKSLCSACNFSNSEINEDNANVPQSIYITTSPLEKKEIDDLISFSIPDIAKYFNYILEIVLELLSKISSSDDSADDADLGFMLGLIFLPIILIFFLIHIYSKYIYFLKRVFIIRRRKKEIKK